MSLALESKNDLKNAQVSIEISGCRKKTLTEKIPLLTEEWSAAHIKTLSTTCEINVPLNFSKIKVVHGASDMEGYIDTPCSNLLQIGLYTPNKCWKPVRSISMCKFHLK